MFSRAKIFHGVSQFANAFLDLLFPPQCVSCKAKGEWWCIRCQDLIERPRLPHASVRGGLEKDVDDLWVTGFYHDPRLRSAIQALKYRGLTAILPALEVHVRRFVLSRAWPKAFEGIAIQAIPAAPRHVRERGFDQAELLARVMEQALGSAHVCHLVKRRETQGFAQATLEAPELRAANVHHVFSLVPNVPMPRTILLVDDVVTTGSTMREVARVLREAGAEQVYGFALALGA